MRSAFRCSAPHPPGDMAPSKDTDWTFPFEGPLHHVFPALHEAQNAWLAQIDSLRAPDRKTHELIRMVCNVILRTPEGVRRHAMLAREVGATWEELVGSIMLTLPGFGLLPAVSALASAARGFASAPAGRATQAPPGA